MNGIDGTLKKTNELIHVNPANRLKTLQLL